jgi:hypothetical protein
MLRKTLIAGVIAMATGSLVAADFAAAGMFTGKQTPQNGFNEAAPVILAQAMDDDEIVIRKKKRGKDGWRERRWRGDRYRGDRYRYRHGRYRHFHDGYWYATPWWLLTAPLLAPRVVVRSGNRHVQWCLNRYRSYKPETDTFTGYDGYEHRCNSPYR